MPCVAARQALAAVHRGTLEATTPVVCSRTANSGSSSGRGCQGDHGRHGGGHCERHSSSREGRRESARTAISAGTHIPRPFPLRLPLPLCMQDRRNGLQRRLLLLMFLQDLRSMLLLHVFLRKNALLTRSVTGVAITTRGPTTFARLRASRDPHSPRAEWCMRQLQPRSALHQHMPNLFLKASMCRGGRFALRKPCRPATVAHAVRMFHPRFPPRWLPSSLTRTCTILGCSSLVSVTRSRAACVT